MGFLPSVRPAFDLFPNIFDQGTFFYYDTYLDPQKLPPRDILWETLLCGKYSSAQGGYLTINDLY